MDETVSITRLPISKELMHSLQSHRIETVSDIFQYSPTELSIILDINFVAAVDLIDCASLALAPSLISSWEIYESIAEIETTIPLLRVAYDAPPSTTIDPAFSLQIGSVNEIVGGDMETRADACLSAAATVVLDRDAGGMGGGVVYIASSEQSVDVQRMNEILHARVRLAYLREETPDSASIAKRKVADALGRVHIRSCATAEETVSYLGSLGDFFLENDVRLVIIENVDMFSKTLTSLQRHYVMANLISVLKTICVTYELCVCCTNEGAATGKTYAKHTIPQSAAAVSEDATDEIQSVFSGESRSVSSRALMSSTQIDSIIDAKLGVAWNHGVTYRFTIFGMYNQLGQWHGSLFLVKSAEHRLGGVGVRLEKEGLVVDAAGMLEYRRNKYAKEADEGMDAK